MDDENEINMDENTPIRKSTNSPQMTPSYETLSNNSNIDLLIESENTTPRSTYNKNDLGEEKKSIIRKYVIPNIGITIFALFSIAMILIFRYVANWNLDWKGWFTVTLIFLVLGILLKEITEPELVMLGALVALVITKIITPAQSLAGFGNEAIVTIGILFVVSKGIENTNALEILLRNILGNPKSLPVAIIRMMVPVCICSAFMNNTPVVAMMIPVIQAWAKRNRLSDRKLLMPLSWASILGGTCTLIGTSTNLIVYGFAQFDDPNLNLNIFEIGMAGAPLAVCGIIYVIIFNFLLNDKGYNMIQDTKKVEEKEYIISFVVKGRRFMGKKIIDTGLWDIGDLELISVIIKGKVFNPSPDLLLDGDMILNYRGTINKFSDIISCDGVDMEGELDFSLLKKKGTPTLVEVVVSQKSNLVGNTPNKINFNSVYNAIIISIYRTSENCYRKIEETKIEDGDCLLLRTTTQFIDNYKLDSQFSLVSKVDGIDFPLKEKSKMVIALLIVIAMISVTSTGYVSLLGTSLFATLLMLFFECLTIEQAWGAVRGNLLMIIAAAFALGIAMDETGTAKEIAKTLVNIFKGVGDFGILFGLFFATSILTSVISNGATVSVMYPIAYEITKTTNLQLKPVIYVLMFAGSACFSTPFGYQTNLMVTGPGKYSFSDFVKFGLPMQIVLGIPAVLLSYYIYQK